MHATCMMVSKLENSQLWILLDRVTKLLLINLRQAKYFKNTLENHNRYKAIVKNNPEECPVAGIKRDLSGRRIRVQESNSSL